MIKNLFTTIWKYFDIICFLVAIVFVVWGCFLLSFVAGLFSVAVSLIIIGYLSEKIASLQ
ncbi:DUF1056 family protein [Limosilactobacillus reuteri]|uniref:DUF1056 family protein n=1 Tax=Limosilactobacillus reuteri TaxID=1598 RepID=UPI00143DA77A|nr:DUF1056 family protein [Limosilactobacillus reuteri]